MSKILSNVYDEVRCLEPYLEKPIILLKSRGDSNKLVVLKNSWYIKEKLTHSGLDSTKVLTISGV